jgi:hypothetical protein
MTSDDLSGEASTSVSAVMVTGSRRIEDFWELFGVVPVLKTYTSKEIVTLHNIRIQIP